MTTKFTLSVFMFAIFIYIANTKMTTAQVVKEDFNYTAGSDLDQQGENADGWAGPWTKKSGVLKATAGSIMGGAGIHVETVKTTENVEYFRTLDHTWLDNKKQTIWISYYSRQLDGGVTDWGGLSLFFDDGTDNTELIFFGTNWNVNNWGMANGGLNIYPAAGTEKPTTEVSWLVLQINMSGDYMPEDIYMYVNPSKSSQPATSSAYISTTSNDLDNFDLSNGFNNVRLGAGFSGLTFEKFRIGLSYSDISEVVKELSAKEINLNVYPNPVSEESKLTFTNKTSEEYTFTLYDITGKEVKKIENITNGEITFNRAGLENGMYFYKLQNSFGASANGKLIIK